MSKKTKGAAGSSSVSEYTDQKKVQQCIAQLQLEYGAHYEHLYVSDVVGEEKQDGITLQYVDLVQKGGGMLGIALVGYTYILEEVGIRFVRLAGTSAGAINTAMMAVIHDEQAVEGVTSEEEKYRHYKAQKKSGKIIEYMTRLNFFDFVDGHPVAKKIIQLFTSGRNFGKKVRNWVVGLLATLVLLVLADIFFTGLEQTDIAWSRYTRVFYVLTGIVMFVIVSISGYAGWLLTRLKNSGYGINPGEVFFDWVKKRMKENNVYTKADLDRLTNVKPIAKLRDKRRADEVQRFGADSIESRGMKADVTFITSELVTQNKIELPGMWDLFDTDPGIQNIHPAFFVRASMSIPIFFESPISPVIDKNIKAIEESWKQTFDMDKDQIPETVKFVDGGMLSNFPLSLFYNPSINEPRLPSLGIDLDDSVPDTDKGKNSARWSLGKYLGSMLNTMRNYYDKDFVLKNKVYGTAVGKVDMRDFNWLDFGISEEKKKAMFVKGAQAATDFLMNFDWMAYKRGRMEVYKNAHEEMGLDVTSILKAPGYYHPEKKDSRANH